MEQEVCFHLEDFEGPLDLLLALISKNKMSIYEIEILTLIDQYLVIVNNQQGAQLDSKSEFITMAARLVQMKSTLLLPRSEEGEKMREELTGLLVEYSACKEVAGKLGVMAADVFIAVRKPLEMELDTVYTGNHDVKELAKALSLIAGRSAAKRQPRHEQFEEIVAAPFVSVSGRVIHVLRGLVTGKFNQLWQLFARTGSRGETVATFLAVLELIRGGRITIEEDGGLALAKNGSKKGREEVAHGAE